VIGIGFKIRGRFTDLHRHSIVLLVNRYIEKLRTKVPCVKAAYSDGGVIIFARASLSF
jgi:hypothetical protein